MPLSILSVAYPFAPVSADSVGGAEQILFQMDRALVAAGHTSMVVACEGSSPCGELIPVRLPEGEITDQVRMETHAVVRETVRRVLACRPVDVIHMHGIDFIAYLPPPGKPVVTTMHLPLEWYADEVFRISRADTHLVCVSDSQMKTCPEGARVMVIPNGVDLGPEIRTFNRRGFAFCMGRICPEKGIHTAIEAACLAGVPLLIAGQVFPYAAHLDYFGREVLPRLNRYTRFVGPAGLRRKRRLLSAAKCVLLPSTAPETSSLVAMEAFACGTPVIAFRSGALPEIVDEGVTGFLVNDAAAMAQAIGRAHEIDPAKCRQIATTRFRLDAMVHRYFELYATLRRTSRQPRFKHKEGESWNRQLGTRNSLPGS